MRVSSPSFFTVKETGDCPVESVLRFWWRLVGTTSPVTGSSLSEYSDNEDEKTGEIIPTGKSGRKKGISGQKEDAGSMEPITEYIRVIEEKDALVRDLKAENRVLKKERQEILQMLNELCRKLTD